MNKRLWSVLLTLAMLLSLLPVQALAVEAGTGEDDAEIIYETHPGIGSIEDILILPATSGFGLNSTTTKYDTSYYKQLDANSQTVYNAIYASELKNGPTKEKVTLTDVTYSDPKNKAEPISAAIAALVYDHPELSWLVNTSWKYGYNETATTLTTFYMSDEGYADATTPYTDGNYSHADTKDRAAIEKAIQEATTEIGTFSNSSSDYEKIKAIHDWVCNNMKYTDQKNAKFLNGWRGFQTVYSALVEGDTVCAGYAKSFKLLCDEYKIPCAIITGTGNGGPHAWNYVQCGDLWYGVDCTWDDLDPGVRYDYFLKGKATFTKNETDHIEGTLYDVYKFAFPQLATADYTDTNSPDSIEITYDKTNEQSAGEEPNMSKYFLVPTVTTPNGKNTLEVNFSATPEGGTTTKIDWILSIGADGVTLRSNTDGTATLVIDNTANAGFDPADGYVGGYVVTVTAMCGTTTATQEISIRSKHKAATFVQILDEKGIVTEATIAQGEQATYTTKVYDQYGLEMNSNRQVTDGNTRDENNKLVYTNMTEPTVTWSVTPVDGAAASDVKVETGTVSVADNATAGKHTVTATSGTGKAEVIVTVPALHEHKWGVYQYDKDGHWRTCSECTATDEKTAHTLGEVTQTKAPTCTEKGEQTSDCTACGYKKVEEVDVTGHSWSKEWTSDDNNHWYVCTNKDCTAVNEQAAHNWKRTTTKEPTCTETGVETLTCMVCAKEKPETIKATGHNWDTKWTSDETNHWHVCTKCDAASEKVAHALNTSITTAPTFDAAGVKTTACAVCDYEKTETVAKLEHTYSNVWSKDETTHWHACTDTGYTELKMDEAAHTWNTGVQTTAPTYTAPGVTTFTCTACGQTKTEPVAQLVHSYDTEWSHDDFRHWHVCTDPGFDTLKQDDDLHTWSKNEEQSTAATETDDGTDVYTCTTCGKEKRVTIGATGGHEYDNGWFWDTTEHWHVCLALGHENSSCGKFSGRAPHEWIVTDTQEWSHSGGGQRFLDCVICGAVQGETIKHTVSALWSTDDEYHWHACEEADCTGKDDYAKHEWGEDGTQTVDPTLDAPGMKVYTCIECNKIKLEEIPQLGHNYSDEWSKDNDFHWHVCTDEGYEGLISNKATHTWNAGEITTAPTMEATGIKTFTCTVCEQTRTETLPKLNASHTHAWATDWDKNATHHWHNCTVSDCDVTDNSSKDSYGAHVYTDDADTTCNTCGYERTVTPPATGFVITFDANGGTLSALLPTTATTGTDGKLTSLPTPTRSGYTFNGWFTAASGGTQVTANTVFSANTTIYAQWTSQSSSGGGGGGGGGGSSESGTTNPSVTTGNSSQDGTTVKETTATPNASTKGDTATANVSSSVGAEIVKQAAAQNSDNVVIAPKISGDVNKTQVTIPASTVADIGNKTSASLTVATPVADVSIPNSSLSTLSKGGAVTVTAEKTGNTVELTISSGSNTLDSIPGGVKLTVPMDDTKPGTVAVLVKEDGTREVIRKSLADGDGITVPMEGSAKIEIVDNSKTFTDVPATNWAADAVAFASAHELFSGTGADTFSPNAPMNRAMLATVLYRLEDAKASGTTNFTDVPVSTWYSDAVTWANENGIVNGTGSGFNPNGNVTREQLATMLYRYAQNLGMDTSANGNLNRFTDGGATSSWAKDAMSWAVGNGLISGKGNGVVDPTGGATRAEVATILQRMVGLMAK